ncbi:MAG: hypothetical protein MK165_12550 [Pirellulaceae bacterium]|nr:hypothetical protein [Pirellulaceae bacterium]
MSSAPRENFANDSTADWLDPFQVRQLKYATLESPSTYHNAGGMGDFVRLLLHQDKTPYTKNDAATSQRLQGKNQ